MNNKTILLAALLSAPAPLLADAGHGQKLHEEYCTKCHGSEVYTRKDRFVVDANALTKQVQRCHLNVGAQWSDKDIADVVQYLDQTYYHFR